ncbi:MAG: restriction endonuclease [Alphaproteobacteria bacterium]|nr:restriction endonuclease [Alphaproteobacteria bacterium]
MEIARFVPDEISQKFDVREWRNGLAVLAGAHSKELSDVYSVLKNFRLYKSYILKPGGSKSPISSWLDSQLYKLGWKEKKFDTSILVDGMEYKTPTHAVDCFKNRVALEVEWNNKDPFFDRDLNNFRLLFELRAIDVGIIITRCDELQTIIKSLGRGSSYGASTTHLSKLLPRIDGGGGGGCPIVVFGIRSSCYVDENHPETFGTAGLEGSTDDE